MGSSFSLRSTVECRGSGRGVSPFTSHLGAIVVFVLVSFCVGWVFGFVVCVVFFAPGFFAWLSPGANRASSGSSQTIE